MNRFTYLVILLAAFGLALVSCSKDSTGNDSEESKTYSFTTANVKTAGTQYFRFSSNTANSNKSGGYDLAFGVKAITEEVGAPGSCVYFTVNTYPVFSTGPGVTMARVDAASLNDVTDVPADNAFKADDTLRQALIGKDWFDAQNGYKVRPDVWVIKTCAGNYGLVQFRRYDFDFTTMHIVNIVFDYKYNPDGSTDFSAAELDSFQTGNGYEATRYFSFADGSLQMAYGTWELQVEGSAVWLGPNVTAYKIENTNINDVTTIQTTGFSGDQVPSYVSAGWYDTDENHTVIPKDYVYVVKTSEGKYAALKVTNYYDEQGNSGAFTFEWKFLK